MQPDPTTGPDGPIVILVTVGSEAEAESVADALLRGRLAACVTRLGPVQSRFWWDGEIDTATEYQLFIKSRRALWDDVLATIRSVHSYETFEALALPVLVGSPEYLQWMQNSTARGD